MTGVAEVTFGPGGQLVALIAGAGCSHGLAGTSNQIVRVHRDRSVTTVADLSAFLAAHPVASPDAADFEPDGTWYSFVTAGRGFFTVEPNHQELDMITGDGHVRRVIDFSKFFPGNTDWRGPTAVISRGGSLYIGTLTPFPVKAGAAEVFEFPMSDRDPVERWSFGRVTLLGDAAHPMYPIGSNGASQAVLDAAALSEALAGADDVPAALREYEARRLGPTSAIVRSNREMGPEVVMQMAEERAPDGFDRVEDVFRAGELEEIARRYKQVAGFDPEGLPVGGDGPIRIAPDREQVAEDVMLPGVTGPASDRLPGRGDGLVDRLQPLVAPVLTQEDRAQASDVPRLRGPQLDQRAKGGDRVLASSHSIEQVA